MITADEVAEMLGIIRCAVYDLAAREGPIPYVRLGAGAFGSSARNPKRTSRNAGTRKQSHRQSERSLSGR